MVRDGYEFEYELEHTSTTDEDEHFFLVVFIMDGGILNQNFRCTEAQRPRR